MSHKFYFKKNLSTSLEALHNRAKAEVMNWLCYWTQFGFLCLTDAYADEINSVYPLYWLTKVSILQILVANFTIFRGIIVSRIFRLCHIRFLFQCCSVPCTLLSHAENTIIRRFFLSITFTSDLHSRISDAATDSRCSASSC